LIREASKFDLDACVEMMRKYASESPIFKLRQAAFHDNYYVRHFLFSLICGRGFIFVDSQYRGMIAAIVTPNIWCPGVHEVKELAWWVDPEHRSGTIGGKLFVAYKVKAEKLIKEGRAQVMSVSLMANSPSIDLEGRGFKRIESTFCKE
jgi:hypothetical protein